MIIIGHRGAAGLQPENTIPAIKAAVKEGVDRIEFDIRATKDGKLIVFHDPNLIRIANSKRLVSDMTLKEIQVTTTKSGHPIPTFKEALKAAGSIPVMIDCKGKNWATLLDTELKKYKAPVPIITSVDIDELEQFCKIRPELETYVCEYIRPFEAIYKANIKGFTGLNLSFWLLNPLVYFYARHHKLKLMTFTVNRPFLARFLHRLYPDVAIITNVPHRLAPLATHRQNEKPTASASTRHSR